MADSDAADSPRKTRPRRKQVYLRLDRRLHKAAQECAGTVGLTLNAWITLQIAAGVRRWEDPIDGDQAASTSEEVRWAGWTCTHGSHGPLAAADCPRRTSPSHQAEMVHEDGRFGYEEAG